MTDENGDTTYRFRLTGPHAKADHLKAVLTLAVKETELIFGQARVKLETSYKLSGRGTCVVEGGTECGEHLAKLLSGFLIKQVGEAGFRVERTRSWPSGSKGDRR